MKQENTKRAMFATRLGVIATTVGSAVGLGNVWRFPYETGMHGGAAFILIYLCFVLALGIPVMCAEFVLGRTTRQGVFGAFKKLHGSRFWHIVGYLGVLSAILIVSFYSVVAGWTMEFCVDSVTGRISTSSPSELHTFFDAFTSGYMPVVWTLIFLAINYFVIVGGVRKGIERISNILTPLLFILLIAFCVNSLTMSGARQGLTFLFKPDFSQITASVVISAMGQAFFSLSLGLGCMLTYASYFSSDTPMLRNAGIIAGLDTLVAVLAGVLIFPAVFSYGFSPESGPKLVFEVLPAIFSQLPYGSLWGFLFFFMLLLAALTSTISMCEIVVAFLTEEWHMTRRGASALTIAIAMILGVLCALSFSLFAGVDLPVIGSINFFGWFDYGSSNICLPIGGLLISIFAGWILDKKVFANQLSTGHNTTLIRLIRFSLRYLAPLMIAVIFIVNL